MSCKEGNIWCPLGCPGCIDTNVRSVFMHMFEYHFNDSEDMDKLDELGFTKEYLLSLFDLSEDVAFWNNLLAYWHFLNKAEGYKSSWEFNIMAPRFNQTPDTQTRNERQRAD